jgi:uncharacterized protein YfaS (alpha-2-macroglobulin family)
VRILFLFLALNFPVSGFAIQKESPLLRREKVVIHEHWFFITKDIFDYESTNKPADKRVVHSGDKFGIRVKFSSRKPMVKLKIILRVPHSPENSTCPTCKPGELKIADANTVIVDTYDSTENDLTGFYWGIEPDDPRGDYKMEISLEGQKAASYSFRVE